MKLPKGVTLKKAEYVKDYKFSFLFSDGEKSVVDFKKLLQKRTSLSVFLDVNEFKKINIDNHFGDIYWGKDYDMCFKFFSIYKENEIE
jgi:hypothetical protein